jgi:hypothetical protein
MKRCWLLKRQLSPNRSRVKQTPTVVIPNIVIAATTPTLTEIAGSQSRPGSHEKVPWLASQWTALKIASFVRTSANHAGLVQRFDPFGRKAEQS